MVRDKLNRPYWKRWVAKHVLKYYVFWLHNFNRGKLKHNLLTRKERDGPDCRECGLCCKNCECYGEDGLCKIWKYTDITRCREWPITPWQLYLDELDGKCRYYWRKK